jgi:hypothetical protein
MYAPQSLVTLDCGRMMAGLASVTVTPGSTAFCSSVTVPVMVPVCVCATGRDDAPMTSAEAMTMPNRTLKRLMETSVNKMVR